MSTMRYRTFLSWTVPACVIWTLAYVSVGAAAAEGYRGISDRLHFAGYLFVAVIAVFAVVVALVKRWVKRREARFMEHELPPE